MAVIATGLSVAVMIMAMAVVTGFKFTIREKLYSFMGHVHVSTFDPTRSFSLTDPPIKLDTGLVAAMRRIPHVMQVSPFADRPVILQAHGNMEGLRLKGVDSGYHFSKSITVTGKPIDYTDTLYARQIILSEGTAGRLEVGVGDTVQLEFFENTGHPRLRRVRVAALYHSGMEEVDKYYGLCDLRLLQRINNWTKDSINAYQLDLDNEAYADTVSNYIHYHLVTLPLASNTTEENYPNIVDWLNLQSLNGVILLVIMSVVAVISIASVLLILMVDRAAMIGLLKALGMPNGSTVAVFLGISGIISTAGIILGNIVALGMCWLQLKFGIIKLPEDIYYMKYAPIQVVWWQVGAIDVATLALCVFCTWLPALYIRTIDPVKVLQFK